MEIPWIVNKWIYSLDYDFMVEICWIYHMKHKSSRWRTKPWLTWFDLNKQKRNMIMREWERRLIYVAIFMVIDVILMDDKLFLFLFFYMVMMWY